MQQILVVYVVKLVNLPLLPTYAADASPEELAVREVNSGIYVFRATKLWPALERLEVCDSEIPGSAAVLEKLRAEFRAGGQAAERAGNPWIWESRLHMADDLEREATERLREHAARKRHRRQILTREDASRASG